MILHPDEERVSLYPAKRQAPVAQWIEHLITVQKVGGSSPSGRAAAPLGAIHRWGFCISTKHSFGSAFFMPIRLWRAVVGPANWFPVRSETTVARQWGVPDWRRDRTRPARSVPQLFREKVRPACHKPSILGHFSCAGRTFSRTGRSHVAALKPMTPLQPLMQASMKPPSPLRPKTTPKTALSHLQRRWRFQLRLALREQRRHRFQPHTDTSEQRRRRFQTTTHLVCGLQLRHPHAATSPLSRKLACNSSG